MLSLIPMQESYTYKDGLKILQNLGLLLRSKEELIYFQDNWNEFYKNHHDLIETTKYLYTIGIPLGIKRYYNLKKACEEHNERERIFDERIAQKGSINVITSDLNLEAISFNPGVR